MAKSDIYWTVRGKSNTVVADFATNDIAELDNKTRGDTATFELHSMNGETLTVESGETHTISSGETEIYQRVNVLENGTLNIEENGTLIETGGDNLEEMQDYADHAGAFATNVTLNNTQKYREQIPTDADVDSIMIGLEPSDNLKSRGVNGIWGLVTGGSDLRTPALTNPIYSVDIQILAEFSDYDNHAAVESDLSV